MMDKKCVFADNKVCTSSFNSDAIDFLQLAPSTGLNNTPLFIVVQFPTALVGTSFSVKLQESADNTTWTDVRDYGAVTKGFFAHAPIEHKRYLRLVGTATAITAGNMTAFLSDVITFPMNTEIQGIAVQQTID